MGHKPITRDRMQTDVKTIGIFTKWIDRLSMATCPLVLLIFILMFYRSGVLLNVMMIVGGCMIIDFIIIASKYYISYTDGNFIIDHAFRKTKLVESSRYIRVTQTPLALPFSNTLVIHFRGNERYRFYGGLQSFVATDLMIRRLIRDGEEQYTLCGSKGSGE